VYFPHHRFKLSTDGWLGFVQLEPAQRGFMPVGVRGRFGGAGGFGGGVLVRLGRAVPRSPTSPADPGPALPSRDGMLGRWREVTVG